MKTLIQFFALVTIGALMFTSVVDGEDKKPRDPSTNSVLKQIFDPFFKELEEKGYWFDLFLSLELSVNVMQDKEVLDIMNKAKMTNDPIIRDLNNLSDEGSAKILLTEMDTFSRQLNRKGYDHIEVALVRVDISGLEWKNKEDRVLRAMIRSGGSLERVKVSGDVDAELKDALTRLHKRAEKIIYVPTFMTFAPHKKDDKHQFVANISISFYCMKNNKGDIKTLRFDLYLDRLKAEKSGTFSYPWGVENVLPRHES